MNFREVFLKAVDEARADGEIGPFQAMRARLIAGNPRRLSDVQKKCCEEAAYQGYAVPAAGDGAFDWTAFLAFLKELLPIILALFKP